MSRRPTGTVTLLFTDIEGSTRLLHELGPERYAEALAEHRRVLREAFARHGGAEVDTQGDSFFVAFGDARQALEAAEAGQLALARGPVAVRMGVHTGEPLLAEEGYVGVDVHRAARIAAAGHGGQIVVSDTTRAAAGRELVALGPHRLKDLVAPEPLWQLGHGTHPPLASLNQTNLPVQQTPLVGRARDLEAVRSLRAESRVVTLVGPGGAGKTRLALQVAADAVDDFPQGVWWVPLQSLRDPRLVLPTIAHTLGARGSVADHVAGKRLLLLLDNAEQVVDAAGELAELLAATTNLELLVTSREPLNIAGEAVRAVEPLSDDDAVELFDLHAPGTAPREVAAAICRRVDCLPLAVELAAARVRLFPPDELVRRLEQRLPMLTAGRRDAPERQRTLRATIEWSHDLLGDRERVLFRRLAVFAGSFEVEAAEAICEADVDRLQSLAEKSLLRRSGGRLAMLDTIHEYARERLVADDDESSLRRRHALWHAELAERLQRDLWETNHERAVDAYDREHTNIREAATWASDADPDLLLRLCAATGEYWLIAGHLREGDERLERALSTGGGTPAQRATACALASSIAHLRGDHQRALRRADEAVELYGALGDAVGLCAAVGRQANAANGAGDIETAETQYRRAVALARDAAHPRWIAVSLINLGLVELDHRRYDAAEPIFDEAAETFAGIGNKSGLAAARLYLGLCALGRDRLDEADLALMGSLQLYRALGRKARAAPCLEALAAVARQRGAGARALRLLGAADAFREETGAEPTPEEQRVRERAWPEADRRACSESDAYAAGRRLDFDGAVDEALAHGDAAETTAHA